MAVFARRPRTSLDRELEASTN